MRPDHVYADDRCEIRISGGRAVVFDRVEQAYYRAPIESVPDSIRIAARIQRSSVPTWTAWSIVGILPVLLAVNAMLLPTSTKSADSFAAVATAVYLVLSVVIHEGAHILALRGFGRSVDRVGFKLNHRVFPAFYVRMNQSLLLSRQEQIVVHAAGVLGNLAANALVLTTNALTVQSAAIEVAAHLVFIAVAWNVAPILNSDGYRVLLALVGVDAARRLRSNPPWLIGIKVAGIVFIVVVAVRASLTLTRNLVA